MTLHRCIRAANEAAHVSRPVAGRCLARRQRARSRRGSRRRSWSPVSGVAATTTHLIAFGGRPATAARELTPSTASVIIGRASDSISATPSAIDRTTTICWCARAHSDTARADPDGSRANPDGARSRNKPDAGSRDATWRIINVLTVDDSVRRFRYRCRDPEC
jgi:hypothetical protein